MEEGTGGGSLLRAIYLHGSREIGVCGRRGKLTRAAIVRDSAQECSGLLFVLLRWCPQLDSTSCGTEVLCVGGISSALSQQMIACRILGRGVLLRGSRLMIACRILGSVGDFCVAEGVSAGSFALRS